MLLFVRDVLTEQLQDQLCLVSVQVSICSQQSGDQAYALVTQRANTLLSNYKDRVWHR